MSTFSTHIADTAARVRPLVRLAGWPCMCASNQGPIDRLDAKLIHEV